MALEHTFRVPESTCPACGTELDAVTAVHHDARPKAGDLSVCIGCGEICQFGEGCALKVLSLGELSALPHETLALLMQVRNAVPR